MFENVLGENAIYSQKQGENSVSFHSNALEFDDKEEKNMFECDPKQNKVCYITHTLLVELTP